MAGEDTDNGYLKRISEFTEKRYIDDNEIIFFSYPRDGTRASTTAGKTVLNYRHGTIKTPDGTVSKMSSSLQLQKKDHLRSVAINCDHDIVIQLDDKDMSPVRADTWHVMTFQQFQELTIATTQTTNIFVYACTNPKHAYEMAGETTVSIGREERNEAKTDKDTHFTGSIAQNAIEEENITGLDANEISITGVSIVSDQQLKFRLWFFETDKFQEANFDDDEFVDFIDLDLATDGAQIGATGAWYYAVSCLCIDYEDLDNTKELHIALQNLSAAAKNAGASGEVKLKCSYIPRT